MKQIIPVDILYTLSTFLSSRSLFFLRLVSKSWNECLTSNGIWGVLFQRDFGDVNWLIERWNINISITRKKSVKVTENYITLELLQNTLKDSLYFTLYKGIIFSLPLQFDDSLEDHVKLKENCPELFKEDIITDQKEDEDGFSSIQYDEPITEMFYYFKVNLDKLLEYFKGLSVDDKTTFEIFKDACICDRKIHKLATLFSLFDKNGIKLRFLGPKSDFQMKELPKQDKSKRKKAKLEGWYCHEDQAEPRKDIQMECSYVIVGYENDFDVIPLSKFAYAMLCGKESLIFTRLNPNIETLGIPSDTTNVSHYSKSPIKSVGVSPYIEGPFTPFCYYLYMDTYYGIDGNIYHDDCKLTKTGIPVTTRIKDSNIEEEYEFHFPGYEWKSDEKSWSPGFWNASFSWIFFASFETWSYNWSYNGNCSWRYNENPKNGAGLLRVKQSQFAQLG
ncbi:hypothetical protein ABK040_004773 [Willaertia magna]